MSIQLPEADTEANVPPVSPQPSIFTRVINSVRIYGIPALNFIIITILATFLLKLTYSELYVKNSLITIIVTNLVLYGISETLAQSLLSYNRSAAPLSFLASESWMYTVNSNGGYLYRSNQPANDEPELNDEDHLERFMDYIQGYSDELTPNPQIDVNQLPNNSYFEFGRLAGFMCWGFIMAFAQCLWYNRSTPRIPNSLRFFARYLQTSYAIHLSRSFVSSHTEPWCWKVEPGTTPEQNSARSTCPH